MYGFLSTNLVTLNRGDKYAYCKQGQSLKLESDGEGCLLLSGGWKLVIDSVINEI